MNLPIKKQKGFSLIELLIVVAIILVIAAIAIPNLLRAKMAANEASAAQSVRMINTAQITYQSMFPDTGFALGMSNLGGTFAQCTPPAVATIITACLIDPLLTLGSKSGYTFATVGIPDSTGINRTFTVTAVPTVPGATGNRGFASDQSGVIRYSISGTPTATSSALQ